MVKCEYIQDVPVEGDRGEGEGSLYGEAQCITGNGYILLPSPVDRMTDTTETITFPQLRWREVMTEDLIINDSWAYNTVASWNRIHTEWKGRRFHDGFWGNPIGRSAAKIKE